MRKYSISVIWLVISALLLSACGGLAGEPEIVGQMPQQNPAPLADVVPPSSEPDIAFGAQLFAENCLRCHGILGGGDGEFVLSGQITNIPDFTDTAQHDGRTATEYYATITNGRIENLMPPFSGSLSDEERWSLANYVLTLAGNVPTEETTASVEATASVEEDTPVETVHGTTNEVAETGTINGAVLQGTTGATLPSSGTVALNIVQMDGELTTIEMPLASDSIYQFVDVPLIHDAGYFVSMDYGDGTFNSEFATLTPASPEINLNITIYETTDDDSVIQLEVVLSQIDLIDENTLQIWQLISVVNTSDQLYVYQDNRGEAVSIEVPAPMGVRLSPNIDIGRFVFNDNSVYDTVPVVPGTEHSFHLLYTMPFDNEVTFTQTLPYDFFGPYEAYVDSSLLQISSDGWGAIEEEQTLEGISYQGIVKLGGFSAGQTIEFTIQRQTDLFNRQTMGYAVIALGLLLIVGAGLFYWRSPNVPATPSATVPSLMKQIAELDQQFEQGNVSQQDYEQQRQSLKDRVTVMMKSEA